MRKKRTSIPGYPKYDTDGINVYRWNKRIRPKNGAYHLVPQGTAIYDIVTIEFALGKVIDETTPVETEEEILIVEIEEAEDIIDEEILIDEIEEAEEAIAEAKAKTKTKTKKTKTK